MWQVVILDKTTQFLLDVKEYPTATEAHDKMIQFGMDRIVYIQYNEPMEWRNSDGI